MNRLGVSDTQYLHFMSKTKKMFFFLEKQEKVCIFAIERHKAKAIRPLTLDLCPLTLDF